MIQNNNFKNWLIRGDCHGNFQWMHSSLTNYIPEETAIIILGDAGINFWLNKTDRNTKHNIENLGYTLYLVKGNHEARPETLSNIELVYDENVENYVWVEPQYPHIHYFKQYGIYTISGYKCLVLGGAYSVDKWYRLERVGMTEDTNIPTKTGWFADEQMTQEEMAMIEYIIKDEKFDFIFSHTCPSSVEPTDMFLSIVDQSKVDKSMENWMNTIYQKNRGKFICWMAGHFHIDRIEAPHFEFYFNDIEDINEIAERWINYDKTGQLDWWLVKGPRFLDNIN